MRESARARARARVWARERTHKDVSFEEVAVVMLLKELPAEIPFVALILVRTRRGARRQPQVTCPMQ
jgi:hypothetical protein